MSTARRSKGKRPDLPAISEEMARLSALLAEELSAWPQVTAHPMFGLQAFYRKGVVFAMLPVKRGFETPHGIAYKVASGGEAREGQKWKTIQVETERDIAKALRVLEKAYSQAV